MWDVASLATDLRCRWDLPVASYIEPPVRFYTQSAAEFYTTTGSRAGGDVYPNLTAVILQMS